MAQTANEGNTGEPTGGDAALPRPWLCMAGAATSVLALFAIEPLRHSMDGSGLDRPWTAVLAGSIALALAACFRAGLLRALAAPGFSVVLLGALLFTTALGSSIVQGAPEAAFAEAYPAFGRAFLLAGLEDVFHSFAFLGLLALAALALGLRMLDWRKRRPSPGFFALHVGGVLAILLGGTMAAIAPLRGFVGVHEGEVARAYRPRDASGTSASSDVPLGFGLRVDKVESEHPLQEHRLYVYRRDGKEWRPELSRSLQEATQWTEAGRTGKSFRLLQVYPDFELRTELRDATVGKGGPGLQVQMLDREGNIRFLNLLAGVEGRSRTLFKESKSYLQFVWEESEIAISTAPLPERHTVFFRRGGTEGPDERIEVKPGQAVKLAGGVEATVLAFYPDFVYDSKTKEGGTKSPEPDNPAVKISVAPPGGAAETRFLFANNPGYGGDKGTPVAGLLLRYRYAPARKPAEREIVVVGSTKEVLEYRRGELKGRSALPARSQENIARGIVATVKRISACVEEVPLPVTRSNNWRNPVAEVEIRSSGSVEKHFLKSTMPFELGAGEGSLVFRPDAGDVRTSRSRVSILTGNGAVLSGVIGGSEAMSHDGFRFYQGESRPEDPTYSGILVVKDPRPYLVWIGFLLIGLAAIGRAAIGARSRTEVPQC